MQLAGERFQLFGGLPALAARAAAERGHGKVERGHRWGSAKVERGHRWNRRQKVGGTTLLPIQNTHRQPRLT